MLLLDAGNSRVKWALIEGGAWSQQGAAENLQVEMLRGIFADLPPPKKILASNVAGEKMAKQLQAACAIWPCPIEFIASRKEQCGVRNLYQNTAQLGSDRWAALIAAWQQERKSCLVVNCGTATTVDALSGQGEFLGGLILPGIDMMQHSLVAGATSLGAAAITNGDWRQFPSNTADAIFTGAIQATVGAIYLQFEALAGQGATSCILSGGAADSVQPYLRMPLVRVDNLVLRGLQIIGQDAMKAEV